MRALVAPDASLADVPAPTPFPHQAVVRVRAASLNRGELRRLPTQDRGSLTGWDLAGEIAQEAADGSGPKVGTRVVGITNGPPRAWAEEVAIDTRDVAVIPDEVTFEQASTLPVAGLTALKALDVLGSVIGKRVLVTGASGGVGRFAIQLARIGGAQHVTALARRREGLSELGADDVTDTLTGDHSFDAIIDGVGGPAFADALTHAARWARVVSFADTTKEPASFPTAELYRRGVRIDGLLIFPALDAEGGARKAFDRLIALVAAQRVDCQIDLTTGWQNAPQAIDALLGRRVAGKAVLLVD